MQRLLLSQKNRKMGKKSRLTARKSKSKTSKSQLKILIKMIAKSLIQLLS